VIQYILRRLLLIIPVLLGVLFLTFVLMYLVPGDPVLTMLGQHADDDIIQRMRTELHLDDPWYQQFFSYLNRTIRGDLGRSYISHVDVTTALKQKIPNTFKLALAAIIVSTIMGIAIGIISAVYKNSWLDHLAMTVALLFISTPVFWFGMLLIYLFSMTLGWTPVSGMGDGSFNLKHLILPALTLGSRFAAFLARYTRSVMLEVISEDYIRTARAKGVKESLVILKHGLRNALIPIVTVVGMNFASLLNGSVLTETIFAWPGFGRYLVTAIKKRDFQVIAGCVWIGALIFVFVNLIVDIIYVMLDPRISYD
jgi:ABC-type dipeptide/oligopeptide/nickel transport system permease component